MVRLFPAAGILGVLAGIVSSLLASNVPDAPLPSQTVAEPRLESLLRLFSMRVDSKEVKAFEHSLGWGMRSSRYDDGSEYHSWKRHGLSLMFIEGSLRTAFCYSEGSNGYAQFQGGLPALRNGRDSPREAQLTPWLERRVRAL